MPSEVGFLVILLILAGLYRSTALGLQDRASLDPCREDACDRPIALLPALAPASPLDEPAPFDFDQTSPHDEC